MNKKMIEDEKKSRGGAKEAHVNFVNQG